MTKIVIVGGVAGGATAAARIRRLDESAEIIIFERGEQVSYANCGLPYHIGNVIFEREKLLLQTPEGFYQRYRVEVRTAQEVISVDSAGKTARVRNLQSGETYTESYDKLILATGAQPVMPEADSEAQELIFALHTM
jgi:NADPH-dependent 2,4-dienoyl-CoA reductase/sulfur reductase-like enzyme